MATEIIRGTTPVMEVVVGDAIDFSQVDELWVSIKQGSSIKVDKKKADVSIDTETGTISFRLTQKETLQFERGNAAQQLRVLMEDGTALATKPEKLEIIDVLKGGEIT